MYAAVALALVTVFALVTIALPLRCRGLWGRLHEKFWSTALCSANEAVFHSNEETARQTSHYARLWFVISAFVFAFLGFHDGSLIRNDPEAITKVAAYGVLALGASSFIILSFIAYTRLLPGFRGYRTLSRCGFRGLWVLQQKRIPSRLAWDLQEHARRSAQIGIVDVSGYELFVKGTSVFELLLHDIIEATPDVPVRLLLLNPMSKEVDPDRQQASVFQTTLAEIGAQSTTYVKKVRQTLETVALMNRERPPEGRIDVRFYDEKPAMRAIVFDQSLIAFPWGPQALRADVPCLQVARSSDTASFYETFRRMFSRMWRRGVAQVFLGAA